MKTKLFLLLFFCCIKSAVAQAPVISGDILICPNNNGTIAIEGNVVYDSYTWYSKFWFTSDPYVEIPGANGPSFTYDWFTYDQSLFKVVVTLNGQTYESNVLQVDSYNWLPISMGFDNTANVSINPNNGNVLLCQGTTFEIQVFDPYSSDIQWYLNDVAIDGANSQTLVVSQPGVYHVVASPPFCPDNVASTQGLPIIVEIDSQCNLSVTDPNSEGLGVSLYPNPVEDFVTVTAGEQTIDSIIIYNLTGQSVASYPIGTTSARISMSSLSSGIYIVEVNAGGTAKKIKFVKQ